MKTYDNELYGHVLAIEMVISALVPRNAFLLTHLSALVEAIENEELSPEEIDELKDGARNGLRRMLTLKPMTGPSYGHR